MDSLDLFEKEIWENRLTLELRILYHGGMKNFIGFSEKFVSFFSFFALLIGADGYLNSPYLPEAWKPILFWVIAVGASFPVLYILLGLPSRYSENSYSFRMGIQQKNSLALIEHEFRKLKKPTDKDMNHLTERVFEIKTQMAGNQEHHPSPFGPYRWYCHNLVLVRNGFMKKTFLLPIFINIIK